MPQSEDSRRPLNLGLSARGWAFPRPWSDLLASLELRTYRDNGKQNGNYRGYIRIIGYILGSYRDNGNEFYFQRMGCMSSSYTRTKKDGIWQPCKLLHELVASYLKGL